MIFRIMETVDPSDPTICLQLNITDLPNETARYLDIDDLKTQLLGYTHDFPSRVNLCCSELSGYLTTNNMSTHIVASAGPHQFTVSTVNGSIPSYNILYGLGLGQPVWDVSNITTLNFYLSLDLEGTEKISLPLTQPVWLTAKIVRVLLWFFININIILKLLFHLLQKLLFNWILWILTLFDLGGKRQQVEHLKVQQNFETLIHLFREDMYYSFHMVPNWRYKQLYPQICFHASCTFLTLCQY